MFKEATKGCDLFETELAFLLIANATDSPRNRAQFRVRTTTFHAARRLWNSSPRHLVSFASMNYNFVEGPKVLALH